MENYIYQDHNLAQDFVTGFNIQCLGYTNFVINTSDGQQFLLDQVSQQFDWLINWAFRSSEGFNRKPGILLNSEILIKTNAVM